MSTEAGTPLTEERFLALLETAADRFGAAVQRAGMTAGQKKFEADRQAHEAAQLKRAQTEPLVPLPPVDSGEPALGILDGDVVVTLKEGYAHCEKHVSGGHSTEIVHKKGGTRLTMSLREALRGWFRPDGRSSCNTVAWEEAEALAATQRALEARYDLEAARFNRGERETKPLPVGHAIVSPYLEFGVKGGGRHQVRVAEAENAW